LLFFDPTDPYTPVGDIPIREQGSYALLDGAEQEPLVKMPFLPASANRIETSVGAKLSERGPVAAESEIKHYGQAAARMRHQVQSSTASDLRLAVERGLARSLWRRIAGLPRSRRFPAGGPARFAPRVFRDSFRTVYARDGC